MLHDREDGRTASRLPHSGNANQALNSASDSRSTRARVRTVVESLVKHEADCKNTEAVKTAEDTEHFAPRERLHSKGRDEGTKVRT